MGKRHDDIDYVPTPSDSCCPYCGGDPTDVSERDHTLSKMGYLHDDVRMECEDCGKTWPCGVPIGEYDGGDDLFCTSCEKRFMRVHRVDPDAYQDHEIRLHLKCPNEDCRYFKKITRESDDNGLYLIGYPDITGEISEDTKAYGYPDGEAPGRDE